MNSTSRVLRLGSGPARSPEDTAPAIPYRDFPDLLKEAIEDALREAWKTVPIEAVAQGIPLDDADETPINRLLRDELEKLRTDPSRPIPQFNDEVFQCITESEGLPDCTGKPFDENTGKPDFMIRPIKPPAGVARSGTYGMYVECKIIERGHKSRTVASYCREGILRFVKGDYAWVMSSAMMVAYLRRSKASAPHSLAKYLMESTAEDFEVETYPQLNPLRTNQNPPHAYQSKHRRSTALVGHLKRPIGPIEITHLWFELQSMHFLSDGDAANDE